MSYRYIYELTIIMEIHFLQNYSQKFKKIRIYSGRTLRFILMMLSQLYT